ncbi:hypothetical protein Lal_00004355 [Lupinus albus]|nr:hypothetical protein Lal_00004355 [Lupinus albus]
MSDANESEAFNILTPEFLNSLSIFGLPNHKIKLKVDTPIMLLRNLDQSDRLCNGTRLVVTKMANHVLEAKIMSGKNIGNVTYIPRLSMSPSQCPWPFTLIRRQFPIIVSYVMTTNKSQGQSLESVGFINILIMKNINIIDDIPTNIGVRLNPETLDYVCEQ